MSENVNLPTKYGLSDLERGTTNRIELDNSPAKLDSLPDVNDNSPAKLDSLQVLVEGHRFFRFPFRFTAGRDAPLFSVLAFFGGDAPLSYNMQKNFVSEQKVH